MEEIVKYIISSILALSVLLEALTKKLKPYSWLIIKIGEIANRPLVEKIDSLESKLNDHIHIDGERAIKRCRNHILVFAGDLRRNVNHTEEEFNNALQMIDEYNKYCASHPEFENNKGQASIQFIMQEYNVRMTNDSFLK